MKNIKKIIILLLVLCICTSVFASCGKHPIKKFKDTIEESDSCLVTMTINTSLMKPITLIIQVDGNISYIPSFLGEPAKYIEELDNVTYEYTKNYDGRWEKSVQEKDENNIYDQLLDEDFFDSDNYEKVKNSKNSYKQRDDVVFTGVSDVIITAGKNNYTMEMTIPVEGVEMDVTAVYSKFNEIELTLPIVE